jgi:hypothetical protein
MTVGGHYMKNVIATVALVISTNAFAEVTQEEMELCKQVQENAEAIMEGRQLEMPIVDWYELADGNKFYTKMIDDAYDLGAMRHPDNQAKQIREFGNKWFRICYKQQDKS